MSKLPTHGTSLAGPARALGRQRVPLARSGCQAGPPGPGWLRSRHLPRPPPARAGPDGGAVGAGARSEIS